MVKSKATYFVPLSNTADSDALTKVKSNSRDVCVVNYA